MAHWDHYWCITTIIVFSNAEIRAALHVSYLKLKHNSLLAFDPSYPNIGQRIFWKCDWIDFYDGALEHFLSNVPSPKWKEMDLHMFRDSHHADYKQTRRARARFMIKMKISLINWYSKKQSTLVSSIFGAGFVMMKVGLNALHAIQHKLRMMVIPISGPNDIHGDNMSVILIPQNISICKAIT